MTALGSRTIGLLHPGEMGAAIGAVLTAAGHRVLWDSTGRSRTTAARAEDAGLEDAGSLAGLVERSEIVFSICPPHAAIGVAAEVAGYRGLYVDANAVSPQAAVLVGRAIGDGGGRFVDGGIVGSPPGAREATRLYLSGSDSSEVADLFPAAGTSRGTVTAVVMSTEPGAASALKMTYAAWTKGTAALILAIRAAARAYGVDDDLVAEWGATAPELIDRSRRAAQAAASKGWRWAGEMDEIASTLDAVGLPSGFHSAAAELYRRSGRDEGARADDATLEALLTVITGTPRS